ncbi:MAG: hypothetical protein RL519_1515 [Pseudomonadota bacterium]|jgi:hypothetical protein
MALSIPMIRPSITVIAVIAFASSASAAPDTDYPHRDWGKVAVIDMSLPDATTCVIRGIARTYERVVPASVDGGTDIDAGPGGGLFGIAHDPWLRLMVREIDGDVTLRVFYRHPVSQKQVNKLVSKIQERCLKVRSISSVGD